MMDNLLITTFAESGKVANSADEMEKAVWSRMGFLNFSEPFIHYFNLMERYPEYQIAVIDRDRDYVVATGNLVPMFYDDPSNLPDRGWDWALQCAAETTSCAPNMVVGLSVSVPDAHRNRGLARVVLGAMRNLVESKGLGKPFLPVRPTMLEEHLDMDIADYAILRREDGRLYDPWLRSHERAGGAWSVFAANPWSSRNRSVFGRRGRVSFTNGPGTTLSRAGWRLWRSISREGWEAMWSRTSGIIDRDRPSSTSIAVRKPATMQARSIICYQLSNAD
ncbi:hypothetical protein [Sphingomonas aerolata]|uniref:hypothetical protein n=1 Tax=Sphingomonas aerolata TaxID=185951 RepID=UPI002FDF0B07